MPIDYSRYPKNWKTEIVPRILKRAGNCCEMCGVENGCQLYSVPIKMQDDAGRYKVKKIWISAPEDIDRLCLFGVPSGRVKTVKVVLTVAHLDHDEENHKVQDERLKACCQWCHLNYDAKEKYRRSLKK